MLEGEILSVFCPFELVSCMKMVVGYRGWIILPVNCSFLIYVSQPDTNPAIFLTLSLRQGVGLEQEETLNFTLSKIVPFYWQHGQKHCSQVENVLFSSNFLLIFCTSTTQKIFVGCLLYVCRKISFFKRTFPSTDPYFCICSVAFPLLIIFVHFGILNKVAEIQK